MNRALVLLVVAVTFACRESPLSAAAPVDDHVPVELTFGGPTLTHARTAAGMNVAFHLADDTGEGAATLILPGGTLHEDDTNRGAATIAALALRRAGIAQLSAPGLPPSLDEESLGHLLESRGLELAVDADPGHLVFRAAGPLQHAALMGALVCGLAFNPLWSGDAIEAAHGEALEWLDERTAGSALLVEEVLRWVLFDGHALGRPAIPAEDRLAKLDDEAVLAFHARTLVPRGALLLAATADPPATFQAAQACKNGPGGERFGALPPLPARRHGTSRVFVRTQGEGNAFVRIGGRAPPPTTPGANALGVVMESIANGFSSTLVRELRTRRGIVYGVEAGVTGTQESGEWYVATSTAPANVRDVVEVITQELRHVHRRGLDDKTWQRFARANALSFAYGREAVTELLGAEADGWILGAAPGQAWATPSWLWRLGRREGWSTAQQWLDPAQSVLVVAGGADVVAPFEPDLILDAAEWAP